MLPVWIALQVWFTGYLFVRRLTSQLIAAIVIFMRGMALGPFPMAVCEHQRVQQNPQILIRTGFLALVRQPLRFQP